MIKRTILILEFFGLIFGFLNNFIQLYQFPAQFSYIFVPFFYVTLSYFSFLFPIENWTHLLTNLLLKNLCLFLGFSK